MEKFKSQQKNMKNF